MKLALHSSRAGPGGAEPGTNCAGGIPMKKWTLRPEVFPWDRSGRTPHRLGSVVPKLVVALAFLFVFETGSHCAALAGLCLTASCLYLLRTGIKGVHCHTRLSVGFCFVFHSFFPSVFQAAGLRSTVLLPLPPQPRDHRCLPPSPAGTETGIYYCEIRQLSKTVAASGNQIQCVLKTQAR